jgi:hypothetical protein
MYPSCGSVLHTFLFGRVDQSKTLTSFLTSSCACFVFYDLFDKQIRFIKMLVSMLLYPVFELFVSIWAITVSMKS